MNSTEKSGSVLSVVEADVVSQNPSSNSQLVNEVFSLFKGYLTSQLEEKGKQFERSSKSDKEAADIKFKGNRKQFELNSQLDNILTRIDESASSPADVHKLVEERKTAHQRASEVDQNCRQEQRWLACCARIRVRRSRFRLRR